MSDLAILRNNHGNTVAHETHGMIKDQTIIGRGLWKALSGRCVQDGFYILVMKHINHTFDGQNLGIIDIQDLSVGVG